MKYIIWASIGIIIAIVGLIYLGKLLLLKKNGIETEAEVISVREKRQNDYIHKMRFGNGDKVYEFEDKAGFSEPFKIGSKHTIIYDPKNPKNFDFAEQIKKNLIVVGVMVALAVLFSIRWFWLGKLGT
ncbi:MULTISPECIES: DUF3592 domain-containing protein [Ruminococcus]|uniref:DUF3592 domain-containing protein n=1 Tax=Ruminococcus flavefaciens TaxID=1265 RepID=A0A1M7MEX2_RUMFL|nr:MULTISPECIES: DUF3592 domain-containing protein [Ruminococcus]MCR4796268.1 hypothetical protein [Ruminococcus sp.]SHM89355.1 hypothetical protein SAMN04487860_1222 [Ruminococcus flavefaciens]